MKTHDLITILAQDAPVRRPFGPLMAKSLAVGFFLSFILMIAVIGLREDLASVIETARVAAKITISAVFAACACTIVTRIGRPGEALTGRALLLLLPILLLVASVGTELMVVPQDQWVTSLVGNHAIFCLISIPFLSVPPLVALFLALRQGAPERPGLAGGVAGLAAAGMASALYALHCPDDSPLFVATWYVTATLMVVAIGALAGRRWLRW